jgi:hypothetical protein
MQKLNRIQIMNIIGGKTAPPPCSICNDPNESPTTGQIATYYQANSSGCFMGGSLIDATFNYGTCVFYTTQYSCPNSGLNPNAGGFCEGGGGPVA